MIILFGLMLLQSASGSLLRPDSLLAYNLCVYRMAEARVNYAPDPAVEEALLACENGPLLDAAVAQVIGVAAGTRDRQKSVAEMLRSQAGRNALMRVNLIRSFEKDHAPD